MSDSGTLGELLRSRIAQCDALEQEVEIWKRRHARAVEVAEGNARRVAFWQEQSDTWKRLAHFERGKADAAARYFCRCSLMGHKWFAASGPYATLCTRTCCRGRYHGSRLRADIEEMIRALEVEA